MTASPPTVLVVAVRRCGHGRARATRHRIVVAADADAALARVAEDRRTRSCSATARSTLLDRLPDDAVPVIVLAERRDVLLGALQRGAHDCMVAPFDPAELDARLAAALRVRGLHDALVDANRRLAEQALTDELTGLANRRHGEQQLERQVALASATGTTSG